MRLLATFISGRTTLFLSALFAALVISVSFGLENAWDRTAYLIQGNTWARAVVLVVSLHFLLKGVYTAFVARPRRFASGLIFVSLGVFISGLCLSIWLRDTEVKRVASSDVISDGLKVIDVRLDLPAEVLAVGETVEMPAVDAEVFLNDNGVRKTAKPRPFIKTSVGFTYVNDAGIFPHAVLVVEGMRAIAPRLKLLPPGKVDSFRIDGAYQAAMSLFPEREFQKGRLKARSYNLKKPIYRIVIKKGDKTVLDTVIHENETRTAGGVSIACGRTDKWAELIMVRDRAVMMIYIGIIGLLIGAVLYPVQYILE